VKAVWVAPSFASALSTSAGGGGACATSSVATEAGAIGAGAGGSPAGGADFALRPGHGELPVSGCGTRGLHFDRHGRRLT
jgi:hypothetical protein